MALIKPTMIFHIFFSPIFLQALVWDQALTGPLDLIAKYQFLREREVTKMFPLKSGRLPASSVENIVFITRPETSLMKIVAENVKKYGDMTILFFSSLNE